MKRQEKGFALVREETHGDVRFVSVRTSRGYETIKMGNREPLYPPIPWIVSNLELAEMYAGQDKATKVVPCSFTVEYEGVE